MARDSDRHNRHDFAKSLPAFDKALRKIVEVPNAEVEKRENYQRKAKQAKK